MSVNCKEQLWEENKNEKQRGEGEATVFLTASYTSDVGICLCNISNPPVWLMSCRFLCYLQILYLHLENLLSTQYIQMKLVFCFTRILKQTSVMQCSTQVDSKVFQCSVLANGF